LLAEHVLKLLKTHVNHIVDGAWAKIIYSNMLRLLKSNALRLLTAQTLRLLITHWLRLLPAHMLSQYIYNNCARIVDIILIT
jgi:hypothetical protein